MKQLGISVLFLFFFACKSSDSIPFGYMECLHLDKNEKSLAIQKDHLEFFASCLAVDSCELLLNKLLNNGKTYQYISINPQSIIQMLDSGMSLDTSFLIINKREFQANGRSFISYFIKRKNYFFNRIAYTEPKMGNQIVYDIVSPDSAITLSFFNDPDYLVKKTNCEN